MLRLNKMTDYAVAILARMALEPDRLFNTPQLAERTGVPEPTVAKLLKAFVKAALVHSHRGALGGYRLTRRGNEITVRHVIEAIEGPIGLVDCLNGQTECCSAEGACGTRGHWDKVNDAIIAALDGVTLMEMMRPRHDKLYNIVIPSEAEGSSRDSSASLGMTG